MHDLLERRLPLAHDPRHVQLPRGHEIIDERAVPDRPDDHHVTAWRDLVVEAHWLDACDPFNIGLEITGRPHDPRIVASAYRDRRSRSAPHKSEGCAPRLHGYVTAETSHAATHGGEGR